MKPEEVARRFQHRERLRLADFVEVALPVYKLTVRGITLAHKKIPPIEEFILRTLAIETSNLSHLSAFLGLEARVLEPCVVGLVQSGDVNAADNFLRLTEKGRTTISRAEIVTTEERPFSIFFDALMRKVALYRNLELLSFQEMKAQGLFEISQSPPVRPRAGDLRIPEINRLAKSQYQAGEIKRDLLAIAEIENVKKQFMPAVALIYSTDEDAEVQVGLAIDGKLSADHESLLSQNPSFQKFLVDRPSPSSKLAAIEEAAEAAGLLQPDSDVQQIQAATAVTEAAIADAQDALIEATSLKEVEKLRARLTSLEGELAGLRQRASQLPVRNIYVYDHPPLLQQALTGSQQRLLIISPWITAKVVDADFLMKLETLLRKGVQVHIGHGITPHATRNPDAGDVAAKGKLEALSTKYSNFTFVRLGNTHAKVLIKDREFAAVSSFNWLSFKGDPKRTFRDEQGIVLQSEDLVDAKYSEVLVQFS